MQVRFRLVVVLPQQRSKQGADALAHVLHLLDEGVLEHRAARPVEKVDAVLELRLGSHFKM